MMRKMRTSASGVHRVSRSVIGEESVVVRAYPQPKPNKKILSLDPSHVTGGAIKNKKSFCLEESSSSSSASYCVNKKRTRTTSSSVVDSKPETSKRFKTSSVSKTSESDARQNPSQPKSATTTETTCARGPMRELILAARKKMDELEAQRRNRVEKEALEITTKKIHNFEEVENKKPRWIQDRQEFKLKLQELENKAYRCPLFQDNLPLMPFPFLVN